MGQGRFKITVVVISTMLILGSIATVLALNLENVQDFYEGFFNESQEPEGQEKDDLDDLTNPDFPSGSSGEKKPPSLALSTLLSSSSTRRMDSMTTVTSSDSHFFPLIGTPIVTNYNGANADPKPLLVEGSAATDFLDVYNSSEIITLGNVNGIKGDFNFKGDYKVASRKAASEVWSFSKGALILEENRDGYELGIAAAPLAAYLNIPVIVTKTIDDSVKSTLSDLGVTYTLICGDVGPYKESFYFNSLDDVYELILDYISARFGCVSYITVVNSEDVYSDYGISDISSLAPYLSSSRQGIVINCPQQRMKSNAFQESEEYIANSANELNSMIKDELINIYDKLKNHGLYTKYVSRSPFLAVLGDPYSIPFHYFENPNPSTSYGADDAWIATDDYYADLDDDLTFIEMALGRVLALSLCGTSALISRSICYNDYMPGWEASSRMSDAKNCDWMDTAYAAKGDDWNGAIYVMTRDYWEEVSYLQNQGYTVHTTQRRATGSTVSQDILEYYSSSSMICVYAHGSSDGYQMTDGVTASEVKNWEMGPTVQLLTSCSAARIDVPDIQNTISLTFIEVGVNSYIGGSRTESSGDSPKLTANAIEGMVSSDLPVGIACRNAKNIFNGLDSNIEHSAMRILYGEPAFNPCQP